MNTIADILSNISVLQLLLVWAVVVFAAVMRAFTGFGFALTAVPVFSLFMAPTQAVVLSASLTLAVSLVTLKTYWGKYPLRSMGVIVAWAALGTAVGAYALSQISVDQFQLWIGSALIIACLALALWQPAPRTGTPHPVWGTLTGLASGLLNGAFAIPGPPIVIYAMATEAQAPERARALLLMFFLFAAIAALLSYSVAGYVTAQSPWLFLLALPAMLIGDKLGYFLFYRYGDALYRKVAMGVMFAVGLAIIAQALL